MEEWSCMCRCCLSPGTLVSLLSKEVNSKFLEATSIEVKEEDGLPQGICSDCLDVLNTAHQFRKQCIRFDAELKRQLAEVTEIEDCLQRAEILEDQEVRGTEESTEQNQAVQNQNQSTNKKENSKENKMDDETSLLVDRIIKSEPVDESDDDCYYVIVIDDTKEPVTEVKREPIQVKIEPPETKELNPVTGELEFERSIDSFLISKPSTVESAQVEQQTSKNADLELNSEMHEYIFETQDTNSSDDNSQLALGEATNIEVEEPILPDISNNASKIIKVLTGKEGENIFKGRSGNEIVRLITENQLSSEEGLNQENVIVCEGDDSNFEIYDGSELVIEYSDEGLITVIQQEDGTFLCSCGVQLDDLSQYENHQYSHNEDPEEYEYVCNLCGKDFESKEVMTGHTLLHTTQSSHIQCPFCTTWVKRNSLTQHIKYSHNNHKPRCELCLKTFANPNNLKRHMVIHTGEKLFQCDVCNKKFNQKITLQTHRLTHLSNDSNKCADCDMHFGSAEDLMEHQQSAECDNSCDTMQIQAAIKSVNGETLCYGCQICNKIFSVKSALQNHITNVHMQDDSIELLCSVCGEVLPNRKAMQSHSLIHKSITKIGNRYICKMCGKSCASQAMLLMHERVHTNERPFSCPLCPLRFKTKTHLRTHHLTHTREKKFGCSVCMKFFALKGNLVVHLRTHTGERPYVCSLCGDAFIDSKYLKKHKLRKHAIGNVPWNQY